MSLTPIKNHLHHARAEKYALPLFDVFEMQGAAGVFDAIAEKNAPAIIALYGPHIMKPHAAGFVSYLKLGADALEQPVSLMLDHGETVAQCQKAIAWGFTDVMIDGSSLSLAENIALTRSVVDMAHPKGIGVEAELGHVGSAETYEGFGGLGGGFTDPADVPGFIEDTGVDFLAIAFGTAHGVGKGQPKLNLTLLDEISDRVSIPLVMHGGSGLSDEQFRRAIARGVSKINVSTNLVQAATRGMQAAGAREGADLFSIMAAAREGYRLACARTLDLFGASGKAGGS